MNNKHPNISIIIPVYNGEKYIRQCLDSVINQTYAEIEIICIDDGSTDNTPAILEEYAARDDRFVIVHQENKFAGVARNKGIDVAKGNYLYFLDADDYIDKSFCEVMIEAAESSHADITICRYMVYDVNSNELMDPPVFLADKYIDIPSVFRPIDLNEWIYYLSGSWAWDKLYRFEFVKSIKLRFQDGRVSNDGYFVDVSLVLADTIAFRNDKLITHRTNVYTSLENTRYDYWECGIQMLIAEHNELLKRGIYNNYKKAFVFHCAAYLTWQIRTMNNVSGFRRLYDKIKNELIGSLELLYENEDKEIACEEERMFIEELKAVSESDSILHYLLYIKEKVNHENEEYVKWVNGLRNHADSLAELVRKKHWRINIDKIYPGSRIILYGYGDVGKDLLYQISHSRELQVIGVSDRNELFEQDVRYISPEKIIEENFDYIIITVFDPKLSTEIRDTLISSGIENNKVLDREIYYE